MRTLFTALVLTGLAAGTAHAQLIDTAPSPDATGITGSNRGASVAIQTSTQVFVTRIDADVQPGLLGTDVKFVIWNADSGVLIHETESQATLLSGRQFLKSPALAFNTVPGGRYVLALMAKGTMTWFVDRNTIEDQNEIQTLAMGGIQTTFDAPGSPPKMNDNFDARMLIHGFILNDNDNDNVSNEEDNCPFATNAGQEDADGDGVGDACDPDLSDGDGDGAVNPEDNCAFVNNPDQADSDGDGIGDACDPQNDRDLDNDGVENVDDNCPFHDNTDQADGDADGIGDPCDAVDGDGGGEASGDPDGDGVSGNEDNCPLASNADQADADGDGLGDACDLTIIVDGGGCAAGGGAGSWLVAASVLGLAIARRRRVRS